MPPTNQKRWIAIGVGAVVLVIALVVVSFATGLVELGPAAAPQAPPTAAKSTEAPSTEAPPPAATPTHAAPPSATPTPQPLWAITLTREQLDGIVPPADYFGARGNPDIRVYDLAELAQHIPHWDSATVNSIVLYVGGKPTDVTGAWDQAGNAWVTLHYKRAEVRLSVPSDADMSFLHKSSGVDHPLTDADKNVPVSSLYTLISAQEQPLPRGLEIGKSTLDDVHRAYAPSSYVPSDDGLAVTYAHVWYRDKKKAFAAGTDFGITGMTYVFDDKTHLLSQVRAVWAIQGD